MEIVKEELLNSILETEDQDDLDLHKAVKNTKESKEAVKIIKKYEEILENQNKRIINIERTPWEHMGKQGQLLK